MKQGRILHWRARNTRAAIKAV